MLDRTTLTSEQADYVSKIAISGKALLGILNDILDFSKIDAGRLDLDCSDFELNDITSTLATIMSVAVGGKLREGAKLADTRSPIVIMVTAFTREEMLQSADAIHVDGMLVKPVTASALLNLVTEIQTRRLGGTGPLLDEIRRGKIVAAARLNGLRILVVEDNSINQDVARRILEDEGAIVELADDGTDAVTRLGQSKAPSFDLVLMDVQMPVMDGFTATAIIREDARLKALPIIALTAGVRLGDQQKCLGCGMNGFVSKPFDVNRLVNTILHHVGRDSGIQATETASSLLNGKVTAALDQVKLKALIAKLVRGDLNAHIDYRAMRPSIIGHIAAANRITLDRMVEELDFEGAARILKPLSSEVV